MARSVPAIAEEAACYAPRRMVPTHEETHAAASTPAVRRSFLRRLVGFLGRSALRVLVALVLLWTTLALYWTNLPFPTVRLVMAIAFALVAIYAIFVRPSRNAKIVVAGLVVATMVWWSLIPPSHDRPWRAEVAVLPRMQLDGDILRVEGVRNFHYRSRNDFDVAYEERTYDLRHLTAVDFYVSDWGLGIVGHTFVSFVFDNAPPLCISIEIRPEEGEGFAPLASMFKQLELIYIVGDERDLVGVRTKHRGETVYLHRVRATPQAVRRLLEVYVERINELYEHPEWYHLLKNNCSINIVRYANAAGRVGGFDWRFVVNGLMDGYLWATGAIDNSISFAELREQAIVNDRANAAIDDPDFSARIREGIRGIGNAETPPKEPADAQKATR